MKTTVTTLAVLATLLSGCALFDPIAGRSVSSLFSTDSGEFLVLDSSLKPGSSRDDLIKSVSAAVDSQLSGGVASNAAIVTVASPAQYPLDPHRPTFVRTPLDKLDPIAQRTAFVVDGKALHCPRAAITVHGANTDTDATGEHVRIFACIVPFDGGYRTTAYASYERSLLSSAMHSSGRFDDASFTKTALGTIRSAVESQSARTVVAAIAVPVK